MTETSVAAPAQTSIYRAALWMMGWLAAISVMTVSGRELSAELNTFQIMFVRSVVSLALTIAMWQLVGRPSLRTRRLPLHLFRNVVHFGAQAFWFLGIALLPIAQVISIEFTAPMWTALLAAMFLGERLTRWRVLAIALGFGGILLIVRPGLGSVDPATLVVLAAAIGFGVTLTITKDLSRTDSALTIIFIMHLTQLPLGLIPSLADWTTPSPALWPWVLAVGIGGFFSHYCVARALAGADATVVTPLDFLRLPLMALVGWWLYQEGVDAFLAAGAALIVLGNFMHLRNERASERLAAPPA